MPLVDVVGKAGTVDPLQYGPTATKVGITIGLIVMVRVVVFAH